MLKKFFGLLTAAALAFSAMGAVPVQTASAAEYDILVLGDGVSTGYGLGTGQAAYTEYLRSATGATSLTNLSVSHNSAKKLLAEVQSGKLDTQLKGAELTVVSIGSYDLLTALYAHLNTKMTAEDIGFVDYLARVAGQGKDAASDAMFAITSAMREPRKEAIANTQTLASEIVARTNGKVVFLTLYNPFESRMLTYNGKDYSEYYEYFQNNVRGQINTYFNGDLKAISGIMVADVYSAFAGNGWNYIFSNHAAMDQEDMFPNAVGHARIAAVLLDTLGYSSTVLPQFEKVLTSVKETSPFYLPLASRTTLYRHAGRTPLTAAQLGDVTLDGKVDAGDGNRVLIFYNLVDISGFDESEIGEYALTTNQKYRADTNGDGRVKADDTNLILRYFNLNGVLGENLSWDQTFLS